MEFIHPEKKKKTRLKESNLTFKRLSLDIQGLLV